MVIKIFITALIVCLLGYGVTLKIDELRFLWAKEGIIPLTDIFYLAAIIIIAITMIYAIHTYIP